MVAAVVPPRRPIFSPGEFLATFLMRYPPAFGERFITSASALERISPSRPLQNDLVSRSSCLAVLMATPKPNLCLPLIRPVRLMPPAAGIRDAVHRRAAPSPLCPDSAAAQAEAWVRLST